MGKKLTQEEFIHRANLKHSDRYDYSMVEYNGSKNKIVIICKEHGRFNQVPDSHLKGFGCFECSKKDKSINNNDFVKKSLLKHGNKYDYSKSKYINWCSEVIIICKEHGEFKQIANNHLNGKGCVKCAISYKSSSNKEFITNANIKHNNKYNYSNINYINAHIKIDIICIEHGIFKQTPNSHLNGSNCPKCNKNSKIYNTDVFINRARYKHDNRYDYSNVNFINSYSKIKIICLKHGEFNQKPSTHLKGSGCQKCSNSYSKMENRWLDLLGVLYRQIKIDKYKVDGFCPITNTIFEFNGDFWHGNPKKYNKDDINPISKKTFGELYEKTLEKENKLRELGYNLISIWESDFLNEDMLS